MPTVMLIDDSSTIRAITRVYLMQKGLDFIEAEGAEKALQLLEDVDVHLIIADIKMPGMDGVTFVSKLRALKDPRLKALPVVLLTGEKSDDLKAQGMKAGANSFLQKPVSPEALKNVVMQLLKIEKK
jgi:two-component system, chemotaxis family, chemotaxis protein CheY